MKTDRLIALLAADASPVDLRKVRRRFAATLLVAAAAVLLLTLWLLGIRADAVTAARLPMFWWKLLFPGSIAAAAWVGLRRLGQPGYRLGWLPWGVGAFFLAVWVEGAGTLLAAQPVHRASLLLGQSAQWCAATITVLSLPVGIAAFWAERRLAPTWPAFAGAAAGLFAGACAAFAYALHCTEMQEPFIATWYSAGMLVPAALGALAGSRFLRW